MIETPRLLLRPMSMADLDSLASMLGDPEVMRFWPAPLSREECAAWIEKQTARYARDGCGYWLALEKPSGVVAGQAGVVLTDIEGDTLPALGYIFNRAFWGRGLATEAARASRDFVYGNLRLPRAYTTIRPENEASLKVAQRIGMKVERPVMYAGYEHLLMSVGSNEVQP